MEITFATRDIGKGGAGVYSVGIIKKMLEDSSIKKINLIAPENPFFSNKINFIKIPITGKTFIIDEPLFFYFSYFLIKKNKLENTTILTQHNIFGSFKRIITVFHATSFGFIDAYRHLRSRKFQLMLIFKKIYSYFDIYSIRNSKKLIFVSEQSLGTVGKLFPNHAIKFEYIPNFIDTSIFKRKNDDIDTSNQRSEVLVNDGILKLGYVGRIEPLKGIISIIKFIDKNITQINSEIGPFELIVAGSGIDSKLLGDFTFVKYIGKLKHQQVVDFFNGIDLFIFPSKYENFPTVILESIACGCPVLSSNVGDVKKIVPPCMIYDNENVEFINKISYIINHMSSNEINNLRERVCDTYSITNIYLELKEIIFDESSL